LLNDLLLDLVTQIDHSKVVSLVKQANAVPLIQKYLLFVQRDNILAVNEAINSLYLEEENYKGLRASIDEFDQFDQAGLAQQLENHDLLEFRRVAAQLFKLAKKWERSMEISKKDNLWGDAMETVAASKDSALAETLLNYFVEKGEKECFAACLYTCYELIRPDIVLELAWRHDLMNFAMPFMVQCFKEFDTELKLVKGKLQAQEDAVREEEEAKKKNEQEQQQTDAAFVGTGASYNPMMAPLALAPPPGYGGYPQQQQGYPQQGYPQQGMQQQQAFYR
jgi:clathrin heavy chain